MPRAPVFTLEKHIETAVFICRTDLPARRVARPFHRCPAAFADNFAQRFSLPFATTSPSPGTVRTKWWNWV